MIRQISPGPGLTPAAQPALAAVPSTPSGSPAATPAAAAHDARDALAGALPAWDLLPASPFIRRVK